MKSFLITGCGRSGTGYIAALLTKAGIPCTHEGVFSSALFHPPHKAVLPDAPWGEASWLAAPLIESLPPEVLVFHQIRNPVNVIRSLMIRKFFHPNRQRGSKYACYVRGVLGDKLDEKANPLVQCMAYWLEWNRLVHVGRLAAHSAGAMLYAIEDLSPEKIGLMTHMISGSPIAVSPALFSQVPTNFNHARNVEEEYGEPDEELISWSMLPAADGLKDSIQLAATMYGYSDSDLENA